MIILAPPCHPWEPVKVSEEAIARIHCLICGAPFCGVASSGVLLGRYGVGEGWRRDGRRHQPPSDDRAEAAGSRPRP